MSKERFELSCCLFNESNMDFILDKKTNEEYVVLDELVPILNQQDQRIAELEEQLKNAIVPKFKIGQEVFYVVDKCEFKSGEILEIQIWDLKKDNIVYVIEYSGNVWCESVVFATKEEAQAKLEELKGE